MPSRYRTSRKITNTNQELLKSRDKRRLVQYDIPRLRHPSPAQRAAVNTTRHIWKYGDRYYNLANKYYGDHRYWWVIAWWNVYPAEATVPIGASLYIPLNLEEVLNILGV